jgi:NADH-ubiquinone oxidoreductase chain 5
VFAETPRFPLSSTKHLTDGEVLFLFPTGFLFFMTMFHGFIVKDMYTGLGSTLYPELPYSLNMPGEFGLTTGDKLIPLIFSFLGALISMILYYDLAKYGLIKRTSLKILTIFRFFNKRWWFDYLDTFSFRTALRGSYNFFSSVEKGHNESISSNIVSQTLQTIGNKFMLTFQNGFLHVFLTYIVLFFALIVAYKLNDPTLIPIFYAYRVSKKNRK